MKTKQTRLLASRRRFRRGLRAVVFTGSVALGSLVGGVLMGGEVGVNISLLLLAPIFVALVYTAVQASRVEDKLTQHYRDHDLFIKDRHQESHAINMGGREDE